MIHGEEYRVTVVDALVRGRFFETSSGIPVLQVLEEDILAVGTTNPLADVATQAHVTARMSNPELSPRPAPEEGHRRALGPRVRGTSDLRRPRDQPPGY